MTSLYKGLRPAAGVEALACEVADSLHAFRYYDYRFDMLQKLKYQFYRSRMIDS